MNAKSLALACAIVALGVVLVVSPGRKNSVSAIDASWNLLRSSSFETGDFSEWDQTNASEGTLTVIPGSYSGNFVAQAYQNGSGNTNIGHYSRAIWNLPDWGSGTVFRSEVAVFLPVGFYASMQGAVDLMGWDTYPTLNNQMRLTIYNSDKKARLFINENNSVRQITGTFAIPEGQWVTLAIEQKIDQTAGWSRVYMNNQLMTSGDAMTCPSNATQCADTQTDYPVTRIRYGLVAINDILQLTPLTLDFDKAALYTAASPGSSPTPTPGADTQSPQVAITSPTDGGRVKNNRTTIIAAVASDNVAVAKVEFLVNNTLLCTDTTAPFNCNWKIPSGRNVAYTVTATATDTSNNAASHTISVTSN